MQLLRRKLKNGMTVIMEKRELPVVSMCIANRFGAIFEESEIKGIAHVIEHMVFTGTKTRTHEEISREIEKKGGELNAFTAQEVTSFWFKLPSEHVFSGIDILVDILNNPVMNEDKFEREKKVILEEIKMYHDNPQAHSVKMLEENLYDKPFGEHIIGNEKSVSSLKRDFVYEFYKDRYCASNYIAVIVGNADFDKICAKLEGSFVKTDFKYKPILPKPIYRKSIEKRKGIDQAHLVFGVHTPSPNSKEFAALQVMNEYLANGMSSRLFLKIREEKGLAYAVKGDIAHEKNYGFYLIYVGTKKEAVKEVEALILEEFKNVEGMTEKDLLEAKQRMIGLRKIASEESSNVMNELLFTEIACGNAEEYYELEKRIKQVTLQNVKDAAKIKNYSLAVIIPA